MRARAQSTLRSRFGFAAFPTPTAEARLALLIGLGALPPAELPAQLPAILGEVVLATKVRDV